ncbi:MAG: hypothetical protein ACREEK_18365 [Bradyrhizobium sp.]
MESILFLAIGTLVLCTLFVASGFRQSKKSTKPPSIPNSASSQPGFDSPPIVPISAAPQSLLSDVEDNKSVDCPICGKPVAISLSAHTECKAALANAKSDIQSVFVGFVANLDDSSTPSPVALQESVSTRAQILCLTQNAIREVVQAGYNAAVRAVFADRDLSDKELDRLEAIRSSFDFDLKATLDPATVVMMKQVAVLRELKQGRLPNAPARSETRLLVLKKGEQVIWEFGNITRLEMTTDAQYVGRSQGISVRIISGVSYRFGASKGRKVETNVLKNCGLGTLSITNKRIQFLSQTGNKSVSIDDIDVVDRYADGIGVAPKRGKAQIFKGIETAFAAELILAVAGLT